MGLLGLYALLSSSGWHASMAGAVYGLPRVFPSWVTYEHFTLFATVDALLPLACLFAVWALNNIDWARRDSPLGRLLWGKKNTPVAPRGAGAGNAPAGGAPAAAAWTGGAAAAGGGGGPGAPAPAPLPSLPPRPAPLPSLPPLPAPEAASPPAAATCAQLTAAGEGVAGDVVHQPAKSAVRLPLWERLYGVVTGDW